MYPNLCRLAHDLDVGDGKTVYLADRRLHRPPQRHEMIRAGPHEGAILHGVPGHLLDELVRIVEVVAGAEGLAIARQDHDVHARIGIGLGYGQRQLTR